MGRKVSEVGGERARWETCKTSVIISSSATAISILAGSTAFGSCPSGDPSGEGILMGAAMGLETYEHPRQRGRTWCKRSPRVSRRWEKAVVQFIVWSKEVKVSTRREDL